MALGSIPLSLAPCHTKTIKGRKQINELGFSNTEKNSHVSMFRTWTGCENLQVID